jgi:2-phosphosulfolactate phosphatase
MLRRVNVHLSPNLAAPERFAGGVAVVIDVLRATTTMVQALAAGCPRVLPCATVEAARQVAASLPAGTALLAGERDGLPLPGFDLGNSPLEFTPERCRGRTLVMTTSNGTRALLHAAAAERVLVAAFTNLGAVCEQLRHEMRPVNVLCAGDAGGVALEDALLAGALVGYLVRLGETVVDDGAKLAWVAYERERHDLETALRLTSGRPAAGAGI